MAIGIIGAMDEEIEILCSHLQSREDITIGSYNFFKGKLQNHDVVIAKSGIGKVRAASVCTALHLSFDITTVLNTGSAGAINKDLDIGDIIFSKKVAHHDVDLTAFGYKKGQLPGYEQYFMSDDNLQIIATKAATNLKNYNVRSGTIVSGDQFVADKAKTAAFADIFDDAMVCEMESAPIAQVCTDFNTPFLIIRAVSDKADGSSNIAFEDFLPIASKNSARLVEEIVSLL